MDGLGSALMRLFSVGVLAVEALYAGYGLSWVAAADDDDGQMIVAIWWFMGQLALFPLVSSAVWLLFFDGDD
jgi:hypothetical protein